MSDRHKEHLAATRRPPVTLPPPPHHLPSSLSVVTSSLPRFSICFAPFLPGFFSFALHRLSLPSFFSALPNLLDSIYMLSVRLFPTTLSLFHMCLERDVSFKSLRSRRLLPCPLPSSGPSPPSLCVTLLVDFCSSSPSPLHTNEFWALCSHRWCSRQPLAAGAWPSKEQAGERKSALPDGPSAITSFKSGIETGTSLNMPSAMPHFRRCCTGILTYVLQPESQCEHMRHLLIF